MPRGKLRSPEEIAARIKDIRRKHRPLIQEMERLDIQARTLDWAMGGDDSFVQTSVTTEIETETEGVAE